MDDVVQRLRAGLDAGAIDLADIMDAADEIERLRQFETASAVTEPMPAVVSGSGSVTPVPYAKHDEKRVNWPTVRETNHDAAPAAKARTDADSDRTDKAVLRPGEGTGDSLSKAEIDALQHVVEDGRIVKVQDYGALRSLLVRLRPEWENEDDSDRPKPINDERLAALEELSALDQELELTYGITGNPMIKAQERTPPPPATPGEGSTPREGSVLDSRNANEPVAWAVVGVGYEYVSLLRESAAEAARSGGGVMVPLYRQPQPAFTDAEREAVDMAMRSSPFCYMPEAKTLLGLLERLK